MPALATTTYFPDPDSLNTTGLVIAMLVYGWILLQSADYIGDAAEDMLEKCPSYGKIIGALLVPILGAIPDGMMILLSGMGSGSQVGNSGRAQRGVGTLAGSTIMLLTIPFATAIYMNRRPVKADGRAMIMHETKNQETRFTSEAENFEDFFAAKPRGHATCTRRQTIPGREMQLGATVDPGFAVSAWIMMGSTVTYLVVQIPAFFSSVPLSKTPPWCRSRSLSRFWRCIASTRTATTTTRSSTTHSNKTTGAISSAQLSSKKAFAK